MKSDLLDAFSLDQKGAREKALQKEKRRGEFRRVRAATKGAAFGIRHLLKKVDENL